MTPDVQPQEQPQGQPSPAAPPPPAAPAPTPAPAPAPGGTPSPTTIAYLFATRFVPSEQPGKTGQRAWGTGGVVVTSELAAGLVAIALWQLRERGAVRLEPVTGKKLGFIPDNGVRVVPVDTSMTSGGVERAVLDHLRRSKRAGEGKERAFDVANMLCRDGGEPRGVIIRMAIDEAVALGYLDRSKSDAGVIGRLAGKPKTKLEPHEDRIATLAPAAETLALAWRDFRENEADLARLLRSTTYEGIEVRARRNRDDD